MIWISEVLAYEDAVKNGLIVLYNPFNDYIDVIKKEELLMVKLWN